MSIQQASSPSDLAIITVAVARCFCTVLSVCACQTINKKFLAGFPRFMCGYLAPRCLWAWFKVRVTILRDRHRCHPEVVSLLRSGALGMNCHPEGASATEGSPQRGLFGRNQTGGRGTCGRARLPPSPIGIMTEFKVRLPSHSHLFASHFRSWHRSGWYSSTIPIGLGGSLALPKTC